MLPKTQLRHPTVTLDDAATVVGDFVALRVYRDRFTYHCALHFFSGHCWRNDTQSAVCARCTDKMVAYIPVGAVQISERSNLVVGAKQSL